MVRPGPLTPLLGPHPNPERPSEGQPRQGSPVRSTGSGPGRRGERPWGLGRHLLWRGQESEHGWWPEFCPLNPRLGRGHWETVAAHCRGAVNALRG